MESEVWSPIPGLEGQYEVSNAGRVRSLDRIIHPEGRKPYFRAGKMLTPRPTPSEGYLIVTLPHGRTGRVHRLVADAFVPGRADGLEVCHSNGDKTDNRASNLRWDTHSSNMRDVVQHGRHHNAIKTACRRGHELTGSNVSLERNGRRDCLPCRRLRESKRTRSR